LLFARNLTDAAGGNLSCRVGELIVISPRYAGTAKRWQLTADDILVTDAQRNILLGTGQNSRESNVHYAMHANFCDYGTTVIHAHARHILVFAAAGRPLPPILESTRKFGLTPAIPFAAAHSNTLADNIVASLRGREALIKNAAAAAIAPWHGLFLMGKDMDAAFDSVERLDSNAFILLQGMASFGPGFLEERVAAITQEIG
jgi:L-fuculose-phosphate aldolase